MPFGRFEQMIQLYSARFLERSTQFESFTIGPDDCGWINRSDAERDQIIKNGSGCAWLATDANDIMHWQIRLDGDFLQAGIDFEIAVKADIPNEPDAQLCVARSDFL